MLNCNYYLTHQFKQSCVLGVQKNHLVETTYILVEKYILLLWYSVYLLLSPYFCFISLLYLDLYVLGDDALIS